MKGIYYILATVLFGGMMLFASSCEEPQEKGPLYGEIVTSDYVNPVYGADAPDPSVIRGRSGMFYAYTTNAQIFKSEDLVNWQSLKPAFSGTQYPNWLADGAVWATDINYINGKYVLYYALSKWGEGLKNGIGVATALKPEGPFTDTGAMFTSEEIGVENSIDPCYFHENGKHYLAWGSWHGIWLAELTDNALRVNNDVPLKQLAGTAFEAALIHKKDNYYYLFCSIGACCEGLNSTYQTVVGRSESLFGPYVNKEGKDMRDNAYELILTSNDSFVGPGHSSELITDDEGRTWFLYHAYNVDKPEANRCIMLDEVKWDSEGWPYVEGQGPSSTLTKGPVFKN